MDGSGTLFTDFADALPQHLTVRIVSYPPDRFLPYSELADLVKEAAFGCANVVLVAESFSTPLAIQYAAAHPQNVAAVILCAGFASSPVCSEWVRRVYPVLNAVFSVPAPDFVLRHFLLGPKPPAPLCAALRKAIRSVSPSVLAARLRAIAECDVRQQLLSVTAPVLYIQATEDRAVGTSCGEEIKRLRPDTVLAKIAAPHLVLQCAPDKAAKIITAFLEQVP